MGKITTLEDYLAANEFLRETANFHFRLEKNYADLKPLEMPPRELQEDLLRQKKSVKKLCTDLNLNETLARKIFWATVDKLIPVELKHWQRVGCPYCGNMNLEKIYILEFDDKRTIRFDVCKECDCYIKTYGEDDEENIYLRDWTTLHLDLLAEERGLHKCGAVELE